MIRKLGLVFMALVIVAGTVVTASAQGRYGQYGYGYGQYQQRNRRIIIVPNRRWDNWDRRNDRRWDRWDRRNDRRWDNRNDRRYDNRYDRRYDRRRNRSWWPF
jgi:hypothetical protein